MEESSLSKARNNFVAQIAAPFLVLRVRVTPPVSIMKVILPDSPNLQTVVEVAFQNLELEHLHEVIWPAPAKKRLLGFDPALRCVSSHVPVETILGTVDSTVDLLWHVQGEGEAREINRIIGLHP